MIKTTMCAFRVHESSEILFGLFDVIRGVICDYEDLVQVDMSDYPYFEGNYVGKEDSIERLAETLLTHKALLAVGYNCIGALVIDRKKSSILTYYNGYIKDGDYRHLVQEFKTAKNLIGIVKTPVLTVNVSQPLALLAVMEDEENKSEYVYTRKGKKWVSFSYDIPVTFNTTRYVELCKKDEAYAICQYQGLSQFIYIEENTLIMRR